jgi:hypothetical protein
MAERALYSRLAARTYQTGPAHHVSQTARLIGDVRQSADALGAAVASLCVEIIVMRAHTRAQVARSRALIDRIKARTLPLE